MYIQCVPIVGETFHFFLQLDLTRFKLNLNKMFHFVTLQKFVPIYKRRFAQQHHLLTN